MSHPIRSDTVAASQRRFARNIRWQFVANGSHALLGGAYLIALGRFLGPAEFGVFSAVMALVSVLGLLLEMRLQEVVARDFCHADSGQAADTPESMRLVDLLMLEAASRLLPAAVMVLLAGLLARWVQVPPQSAGLIALAAAGFVLQKAGNSVSNGLLRVLGRTDLIAACVASDWALRLALSATLALAWHLDVAGALWVALAIGGLCNGAQVALACREYKARFSPLSLQGWTPRGAMRRLRGARRLIAANLGVSGSDLMAKDLDVALISSMLSADKVGLYKMAKSFVQVLWRAVDPFYLAVMPEVQKLWQSGETSALAQLLRKTSLRLLLLAIALVVAASLTLQFLGQTLLGPGYAGVANLMLVMSGWVLVCAPLIWGIPLAVAINRPELSVGGSLAGLCVGLAAFSMLTPTMGLEGAALAWNATLVTGFVFTTGSAIWFAKQKLVGRKS